MRPGSGDSGDSGDSGVGVPVGPRMKMLAAA